jgi:type IV pilus assembly protein PilP
MERTRGERIYIIILAVVMSSSLVAGCDLLPGKGQKQKATPKLPPQITPDQKTTAPTTTKTANEEKKDIESDYVYDSTDKRDPFQPFIAMQTPLRPADEEIPLTPLQKYDLSQLKLVAILVGTGEDRAMVEDSEGKGYIVKKGVYVGRNFGKVKAVLKDRVIIQERYKDYQGKVQEKEIVLRLHSPGEEEGQ